MHGFCVKLIYLDINIDMIIDSHLMYEKYVTSRKSKVLNEDASQGAAGNAALDQANTKRMSQILDMLKANKDLATKLALHPDEFASVLDWAKTRIGGQPAKPANPVGTAVVNAVQGEAVVKEKKEKSEDNLEMVVKPKSEETEEEYLARRDAAIKASIAAKEESEEQAAISSHYNTNHEALDLVDHLLTHPKKYSKSDVIKIVTLASDKLQNKA
jgi:hypothetical protein